MRRLEGREDFETSTFALRGRCSASELPALGTVYRLRTDLYTLRGCRPNQLDENRLVELSRIELAKSACRANLRPTYNPVWYTRQDSNLDCRLRTP